MRQLHAVPRARQLVTATRIFRSTCATALVVLTLGPPIMGQAPSPSALMTVQSAAGQATPAPTDTTPPVDDSRKTKKSIFAEDGPVDTTWAAQVESFWHAAVRLPVAAVLSAVLAF